LPELAQSGETGIAYVRTDDDWLEKRIQQYASGMDAIVFDSPNFINTAAELHAYFDLKKKYFQTDFYVHQRKSRKILLQPDGKPEGDKWTFDTDNRSRFPSDREPPKVIFPEKNQYWTEAKTYVTQHFGHHYGTVSDTFRYPTTFTESEAWLQAFLHQRFADFGAYEDAIVREQHILHHSVLTPMLNIGLLAPQQVLDAALDHAQRHGIPLNSLEGFVRQILGWREFIRAVYLREGSRQRTHNYWGFRRKIPESFWTGTTGIAPIDNVVRKTLETGYCHHIERLMVLGNFMLLCEFDPDEVYRWFMELFVDAYDWVMVPNVYGMTQFADGGLMTTKPYISGSNYLMKMSDYEKGPWQTVWDGLFWRFMHVHRSFFLKNPRLGMLVKTFDKMDSSKKEAHLRAAEVFLGQLDGGEVVKNL
jgi:deoxyribodipyrimidine photolyase-related protein